MIVKEKIVVRGTSHHRSSHTAYNLGYLTPETEILFKSEPTNPVDNNAIEIFLKTPSIKLGYVPRELALKYTRLLVGGRVKRTVISSAALEGAYLKIKAEIWYRYINDAVKKSSFWASALNMPYVSGVYSITNTTSGRKYIGSSKKVRARIFSHILDLEYGIHSNVPLQNEYNIYGPDKFMAEIMARVQYQHLKMTEESEIMKLIRMRHPLYNMTATGEPLEGGPIGGNLSVSEWLYDDFDIEEHDSDEKKLLLRSYSLFYTDIHEYISKSLHSLGCIILAGEQIAFCSTIIIEWYKLLIINTFSFLSNDYQEIIDAYWEDIIEVFTEQFILDIDLDIDSSSLDLGERIECYENLYKDCVSTGDYTKLFIRFLIELTQSRDVKYYSKLLEDIFWRNRNAFFQEVGKHIC